MINKHVYFFFCAFVFFHRFNLMCFFFFCLFQPTAAAALLWAHKEEKLKELDWVVSAGSVAATTASYTRITTNPCFVFTLCNVSVPVLNSGQWSFKIYSVYSALVTEESFVFNLSVCGLFTLFGSVCAVVVALSCLFLNKNDLWYITYNKIIHNFWPVFFLLNSELHAAEVHSGKIKPRIWNLFECIFSQSVSQMSCYLYPCSGSILWWGKPGLCFWVRSINQKGPSDRQTTFANVFTCGSTFRPPGTIQRHSHNPLVAWFWTAEEHVPSNQNSECSVTTSTPTPRPKPRQGPQRRSINQA